jgi:hypothetical protein
MQFSLVFPIEQQIMEGISMLRISKSLVVLLSTAAWTQAGLADKAKEKPKPALEEKCAEGQEYQQRFLRCLPKPDKKNTVTIQGTLQTGRMAIGGETTGMVLKTNSGDMELLFDKDDQLAAQKLDGKTLKVDGIKYQVSGLELKNRTVVAVTKYAEVK